jgi:hypothetical protein
MAAKFPRTVTFIETLAVHALIKKKMKFFLKGNSDESVCKVIYEEGLPNIR